MRVHAHTCRGTCTEEVPCGRYLGMGYYCGTVPFDAPDQPPDLCPGCRAAKLFTEQA